MPATSFSSYIDDLTALLRNPDAERIAGALDGVVAKELRDRVTLDVRRELGAFPTPRELARRLVGEVDPRRVYVDASLGCGDLLLAVAEKLPLRDSPAETLRCWGRHLVGHDLEPQFVRAAHVRLGLMAAARSGMRIRISPRRVAELLPLIRVGNGERVNMTPRATIVLNPPFGYVAATEPWASGRTSAAAIFLMRLLERAPAGVEVRALLPDVLRSGSRFARWRAEVEACLTNASVESIGRFDPHADVDVFILRGTVAKSHANIEWWPKAVSSGRSVGDVFDVNVGTVVPHREPPKGMSYPYLRARDLPRTGTYCAGEVRRRYYKRVFTAPFVVVRRTSSPTDRRRITATLVTSRESVAVENHLIVLTPRDGRMKTCEQLLKVLGRPGVNDGVNARIRCRHLTVGVLKEMPWRES